MLSPKKLSNGAPVLLSQGAVAQGRVVMAGKTLNGDVALWIEGSEDRAFMKPAETYRLAQVLLRHIGMELPEMEGLL